MVWSGLGGLIPDPQSDLRHLQTVKLVSDHFRLLSWLSTVRDFVHLLMYSTSSLSMASGLHM